MDSFEFISMGFYRPEDERVLNWNKPDRDCVWWPRMEKMSGINLAVVLLMDEALRAEDHTVVSFSKWGDNQANHLFLCEMFKTLYRSIGEGYDVWTTPVFQGQPDFTSHWNMPIAEGLFE